MSDIHWNITRHTKKLKKDDPKRGGGEKTVKIIPELTQLLELAGKYMKIVFTLVVHFQKCK